MIPIRNKKKTLSATVDEMRNFALAYTEKYAPSKQQLRTYLLKKYIKSSVLNIKKNDVVDLIDVVLSDLEKRCHFWSTTNVKGDSHESAYMEGQRSVLLFIKSMLQNDNEKGK